MAVHRQAGNATIGAILATGALVSVAIYNLDRSEQVRGAAQSDKALASIQQTNLSSLAVYRKLFGYAPGDKPAIFPDPYFALTLTLAATKPIPQGAIYATGGNVVSFTTANPRKLGEAAYDRVFAASEVPMAGATPTRGTRVTPLGANVDGWLIASLDVEAATADERREHGDQAVTTRARIALPPPPPPQCVLEPSALRVETGKKVTLTLKCDGVVVGGNLDGAPFGGQGMPPTPAASVNSRGVSVATKTVRPTASHYPGEHVTFTSTVYGPTMQPTTVTTTPPIYVEVPPCAPEPCPNGWENFNPQFVAHGYDLGGSQVCFNRSAAFDDPGAPLGTNGPIYRDSPPGCGQWLYWRNRNEVGCFAPETRITLASGASRAARDIAPGTRLLSPVSGASVQVKEVVEGPERAALWLVHAGARSVRVTADHPFPTRDGLKAARDLIVGRDELLTLDGYALVDSAVPQASASGQRVLNFVLATDSPFDADHYVVAEGIVTGDLALQERLSGKAQSPRMAQSAGKDERP